MIVECLVYICLREVWGFRIVWGLGLQGCVICWLLVVLIVLLTVVTFSFGLMLDRCLLVWSRLLGFV